MKREAAQGNETEQSADCGENPELQHLLERCGHFLYHRRGEKFGQRRILMVLWDSEKKQKKMLQQELMEKLGIRAGSLSEIIGKMEENGLVYRTRSKEDRRKICISITEKGCSELEKANQAIKRQEQILFLSLSGEEQQTMCQLLEKLLEGWEKQFDPELVRGHRSHCCGEKREDAEQEKKCDHKEGKQ
ncbi:MAG: MarR family transcriptional regulator [Fusicatenibacter sp.]|nr:MarR family transcriptional regulator [Lachnospiraceae bacterium]MDY2937295.1 MarR family transcriptional regulator [Fusicatenibacter sp.]